MRSRILSCAASFVFVLLVAENVVAQNRLQNDNGLRIVVVSDGPSHLYQVFHDLLREEIVQLLGEEYEVTIADTPTTADWTVPGVRALMDRVFSSGEADVVIGLGLLVSSDVAARRDLPRPVILPLALAPDLLGLPQSGNSSGRGNLNYIGGMINLRHEIETFRRVVPFHRLAIVMERYAATALSGVATVLEEAVRDLGIEIELVPIDTDGEAALRAIPEGVGAVLLDGLVRLPVDELDVLIAGINERRLPSLSSIGPLWVQRGVLASVIPHEDWIRRARRVALHIQRIQLGEPASELPVLFEPREQLVLNMQTARVIGHYPRFELLTEAQLINEDQREIPRRLTLHDAMREALRENREVAVAREAVDSAEEAVDQARGVLLPQLSADSQAAWIDPDGASFIGPAERNAEWSVQLRQVIYSTAGLTNLRVQQRRRDTTQHQLQRQELDTLLQVGEAYFNVLKAVTAERVQRENLQRTRSHYHATEVRRAIGVAGPEEVYRWEIELANNQQAVIQASSVRSLAEMELNRLLYRPLEEPFLLDSVRIDDPALLVGDPRLERYVDNPWGFRVFRDFMVELGLERAPELQAIDTLIAARERGLRGLRQALFVPTIAFEGGITHAFYRGGEGTEPLNIPPELGVDLPEPNEFNWFVGIGLSFPLFDGGSRYAEIRQNRIELTRLRTEREAVAQQIEQRIRSALQRAGASRPGVILAEQAADAASNNLRLVASAYSRGALSIINLIDAQSQAFLAELAAANAMYDFLIDYIRVERAVGIYSFQMDGVGRDEYFHRLQGYARERRQE